MNCGANLTIESSVSLLFITPGVKTCISCALDMNEPVTWQVELPDTQLKVAVDPMTVPYATETDENYLILYEPSAYVLPGAVGVRQVMCTGIYSASTLEATLASPSKLLNMSCLPRTQCMQ